MEHQIDEVSPARRTTIVTLFLSEPGQARSKNEDSIAVLTPEQHGIPGKGTLLVVADGMGGLQGGGQASLLVTSELPSLYLASTIDEPVEALAHAVHEVNRRVYEAGRGLASDKLMGSTLVAAIVLDSVVTIVNVGDSRAYVLRNGRLRQVSVDHTLTGNFFFPFVRKSDGFSHILTQAIGPHPVVSPHMAITTMSERDLLLLCSDGLTSVVPDAEIEQIMNAEPFEEIPAALRRAIVQNNGKDDFSIIVSRVAASAECELDS